MQTRNHDRLKGSVVKINHKNSHLEMINRRMLISFKSALLFNRLQDAGIMGGSCDSDGRLVVFQLDD